MQDHAREVARAILARCGRQSAPPADALAARPLLERVAAMGDCIGVSTVGEIMAISDRAAAWLAANPPGNLIAIEPRGRPIPGACSCVQPAPPTEKEVAVLLRELRDAAFDLYGSDPAKAMLTNTADLLERRPPTPVPVSERPWEREGWCDEAGKCWLGTPQNGVFDAIWILHKPPKRPIWRIAFSLPAHALPLPAGEVQ